MSSGVSERLETATSYVLGPWSLSFLGPPRAVILMPCRSMDTSSVSVTWCTWPVTVFFATSPGSTDGEPSFTKPSASSSTLFSRWAPVSGAPASVTVGQPSLTTPSKSSSRVLSHWAPLSLFANGNRGQPSSIRPSPSSSRLLAHWAPLSALLCPGQPSLTRPSPSSSTALAHWAPLSALDTVGQPSLTLPSPSSSRALAHWAPLSTGDTVGQPSLTTPSPSSSRSLRHSAWTRVITKFSANSLRQASPYEFAFSVSPVNRTHVIPVWSGMSSEASPSDPRSTAR